MGRRAGKKSYTSVLVTLVVVMMLAGRSLLDPAGC